MRIEIRGRNFEVNDELRGQVAHRFEGIGKQISPLSRIEVVVSEEKNPAVADKFVAEAKLHLKGVTLHAHEATPDMIRTVNELAEDKQTISMFGWRKGLVVQRGFQVLDGPATAAPGRRRPSRWRRRFTRRPRTRARSW